MQEEKSPLELQRIRAPIEVPPLLQDLSCTTFIPAEQLSCHQDIQESFSHLPSKHVLRARQGEKHVHDQVRLGVFFSGGPAPGGHNVLAGLFDGLQKLARNSVLFGFLHGPEGLCKASYRELTAQEIDSYRNTGGFDLLGTGRTKIETKAQMQLALHTCEQLALDGLIIVGGDDSNTNAAVLASFFAEKASKTKVIGIPKTIDGDLKNAFVPLSFGFDTACRTYAEMIGNICKDAKSAGVHTHFIKLMGRSASHVTLECALATRPNYVLIAEEVKEKKQSLASIVKDLADFVVRRSALGKNYAVILVPEGLIEFIPEISILIKELNSLLAHSEPSSAFEIIAQLTPLSRQCFVSLSELTQKQLLLRRDPHGNVQVSLIETEKLLAELVSKELEQRRRNGEFEAAFIYRTHFLGYEGRTGFPSILDATYCYALGLTACSLVTLEYSGYMAFVSNLHLPIDEWQMGAVPFACLLHMEERKGAQKPVIQKALVACTQPSFLYLMEQRPLWALEDRYRYPGPMQFSTVLGSKDSVPHSLLIDVCN
ncbi:MAG: diphosphate--fructose-6-phosphate 1-phosphotransferase [Chlamydiae bacterium]|nr:diphosphate--fructose-6-phosphate 1-phosphotransferase [Chlamydiota bacterium]